MLHLSFSLLLSENSKKLSTLKWRISEKKETIKKQFRYYFGYAHDIRENLLLPGKNIL